MVPIDKVRFRKHDLADICEIHLPSGVNVAVFPANDIIPGSDPVQTYAQAYKAAFDAYKAGELQPFDVAAREAAAASADTEQSGSVAELETAQSGQRARKAEQMSRPPNEPATERKPVKKAKAAKKPHAKAKKAPAKKAAKKSAKAKK